MTDLEQAQQAIRQARKLLQGFIAIDPALYPILNEIDLPLSRVGQPTEGASGR